MGKYNVKLMSRAVHDLEGEGIYNYIVHKILELETALNLVSRIENVILSMEIMSYCCVVTVRYPPSEF